MSHFTPILAVHAGAALVVILLGPVQIFRRSRDRAHRLLGRTWAGAMILTCTTSFLIHPDGFSWLHGLAIFTLVCLALGIVGIRRGDRTMHTRNLVGSYLGTLTAFAFAALVPTRAIQTTLHQDPVTILLATAAVSLVVGVWSAGVVRVAGARPRVVRPVGGAAVG